MTKGYSLIKFKFKLNPNNIQLLLIIPFIFFFLPIHPYSKFKRSFILIRAKTRSHAQAVVFTSLSHRATPRAAATIQTIYRLVWDHYESYRFKAPLNSFEVLETIVNCWKWNGTALLPHDQDKTLNLVR